MVRFFVADHLAYVNAVEADGSIWAFARSIEEGVLVGDGLTILRPAQSKNRDGRIDISLLRGRTSIKKNIG